MDSNLASSAGFDYYATLSAETLGSAATETGIRIFQEVCNGCLCYLFDPSARFFQVFIMEYFVASYFVIT